MSEKFKFDVIIGNPPYQEEDGGAGSSSVPIYNKFMEEAVKLEPDYISFITPSKWFAGGKGLDNFRNHMLLGGNLVYIEDFVNAKEVFDNTSIGGGVSFFLWGKGHKGKTKFVNYHDGNRVEAVRDLSEFPILVRYNEAVSIIHKVRNIDKKSVSEYVKPRNPFGLSSKERGDYLKSEENYIHLISSGGEGYIPYSDIKSGLDLVEDYKVIISKVTAEHAGEPDKKGMFKIVSTNRILKPNEVNTDSYLVVFSNKDKQIVKNYLKYLQTKFYRVLLMQAVTSINLSKDKFNFVPVQNFGVDSDIDWVKSIPEIDQQLYTKYGLNDREITFIEKKVKAMN